MALRPTTCAARRDRASRVVAALTGGVALGSAAGTLVLASLLAAADAEPAPIPTSGSVGSADDQPEAPALRPPATPPTAGAGGASRNGDAPAARTSAS